MRNRLQRLTTIFSENLLAEVASPDADLLSSGILDSMRLIELLVHVEQEFGIRINLEDLDLENFRSISSIAETIAVLSDGPTTEDAALA